MRQQYVLRLDVPVDYTLRCSLRMYERWRSDGGQTCTCRDVQEAEPGHAVKPVRI